jgi:hypothetical protein
MELTKQQPQPASLRPSDITPAHHSLASTAPHTSPPPDFNTASRKLLQGNSQSQSGQRGGGNPSNKGQGANPDQSVIPSPVPGLALGLTAGLPAATNIAGLSQMGQVGGEDKSNNGNNGAGKNGATTSAGQNGAGINAGQNSGDKNNAGINAGQSSGDKNNAGNNAGQNGAGQNGAGQNNAGKIDAAQNKDGQPAGEQAACKTHHAMA